MSVAELHVTIHRQQQQLANLRSEIDYLRSQNYENKYKKALRSIEDIIRANKVIKQQLDSLRVARQGELQTANSAQKQEFIRTYQALLKQKNNAVIAMQTATLENQKLKYTISELEHQLELYKQDRLSFKTQSGQPQTYNRSQGFSNLSQAANGHSHALSPQERETLQSNQNLRISPNSNSIPARDKIDIERQQEYLRQHQQSYLRQEEHYYQSKQQTKNIRQKQESQLEKNKEEHARTKEQYTRTIRHYQDCHRHITSLNQRLEQRIKQLQDRALETEKSCKERIENFEMQTLVIRGQERQSHSRQITQLKDQIASLQLQNSGLLVRVENALNANPEQLATDDWQAELVHQLVVIKNSIEPLKEQIAELQLQGISERQLAMRQKVILEARVLQLQAEIDSSMQLRRQLQQAALVSHQQRLQLADKTARLKSLEEENGLLQGRIVVLQSREVVLDNRGSGQLQERMLQFETRIDLLLKNRQGLGDLREVGIHQLVALKAYILQLDGKLKEMLSSNNYLLRKYKNYKDKYQQSLKQQKQAAASIASLNLKNISYDKLVLRLQGELQLLLNSQQTEISSQLIKQQTYQGNEAVLRKKYQLLLEKFEVQEKYKTQEIETLKLDYQTRIIELAIKSEEHQSLREAVELYKSRNDELQQSLSRKENDLYESKRVTGSKVLAYDYEHLTNTRQTKDILTSLHTQLRQHEDTISKLQNQLRNNQEQSKKTIGRLERELAETQGDQARLSGKAEGEIRMRFEQEGRQLRARISQLQQQMELRSISYRNQNERVSELSSQELKRMEKNLQEVTNKLEQEASHKRRLQQQFNNLTSDKEELERVLNQMRTKSQDLYELQQENSELRQRLESQVQNAAKHDHRGTSYDYELQSKDSIINRLNAQVHQLNSELSHLGEKDMALRAVRNELQLVVRERDELNETLSKYNNQIVLLKTQADGNRQAASAELQQLLNDKDAAIARLRKQCSLKQARTLELQQEISSNSELVRKLRRESERVYAKEQEVAQAQSLVAEREAHIERLRNEVQIYQEQLERLRSQLEYVKENFQQLTFDHLERGDEMSKLQLQLNTLHLKNRQEFEEQVYAQMRQKEQALSRLSSNHAALQHRLAVFQEDKEYSESILAKANQEIASLRAAVAELQTQNQRLSQQIHFSHLQLSSLQRVKREQQQNIEECSQRQQDSRLAQQVHILRRQIQTLEQSREHQAVNGMRVLKQLSLLQQQNSQMEEDLRRKHLDASQSIQEVNLLRAQIAQHFESLQDKELGMERMNNELKQTKMRLGELQEQMEQREQAFGEVNRAMTEARVNATAFQQQVEATKAEASRMMTQKAVLREQIVRLQEQLGAKMQEINRLKQEIFGLKMQVSDRQFEDQQKVDQDMFHLKNIITSYEYQLQDKNSQNRALAIQLQALRVAAQTAPTVSQDQYEHLRIELTRRQKELQSLRFDLEEKEEQVSRLSSSLVFCKNTISQHQAALEAQQQQHFMILNSHNTKSRQLTAEIESLNAQLQQLQLIRNKETARISVMQQQWSSIEAELASKDQEIRQLNTALKDSLALVQTLETKTRTQQQLVSKYAEQLKERDNQIFANSDGWQIKEQQYQAYVGQLQSHINALEADMQSMHLQHSQIDPKKLVEQIDRLNLIIGGLQNQIGAFKLKLASMTNQQARLEQNLITLVLVFAEIDALRERLRSSQGEIKEVRKSFIQMTVAAQASPHLTKLMEMQGQSDHLELQSIYPASKVELNSPSYQQQEPNSPFNNRQEPESPFYNKVQSAAVSPQIPSIFSKKLSQFGPPLAQPRQIAQKTAVIQTFQEAMSAQLAARQELHVEQITSLGKQILKAEVAAQAVQVKEVVVVQQDQSSATVPNLITENQSRASNSTRQINITLQSRGTADLVGRQASNSPPGRIVHITHAQPQSILLVHQQQEQRVVHQQDQRIIHHQEQRILTQAPIVKTPIVQSAIPAAIVQPALQMPVIQQQILQGPIVQQPRNIVTYSSMATRGGSAVIHPGGSLKVQAVAQSQLISAVPNQQSVGPAHVHMYGSNNVRIIN